MLVCMKEREREDPSFRFIKKRITKMIRFYYYFIKEFNYKNGSKLATLELFPKKAGIHFRNKNIEGVLDKIKLTPIIQKSWPDLRFFNFTQFTDSEKNDLLILLNESFKSVTSTNNQ